MTTPIDNTNNPENELYPALKSYADDTQQGLLSNRTALAAATEELERSAASIKQIHTALQKFTADNLINLASNSTKIQDATTQLKMAHEQKVFDFAAFDIAINEVKVGKRLLTENMDMLDIAQSKLKESANSLVQSEILLEAANALALYDHLTKLPNRRLFVDRFNQAVFTSRRNNTFSALLFLDLDKLKIINDTYGHQVGDALLIEVAQRIKDMIRDTDTVARFGGDEFVILISNINTDKAAALSRTELIAEKIRYQIEQPITITNDEGTFVLAPQCTASIGATVFLYAFDDPSHVLESILGLSDKAMYQAKQAGGNQIRIDHV